MMGFLWAMGALSPKMAYGENGQVARKVMQAISPQRTEMKSSSSSTGKGQRFGEQTSNSTGDNDAAGQSTQLREELTAIATHDDAKLATALVGSYAANYEIIREGLNGAQACLSSSPME
ncbi:hypothetical protein [Streptomyces sp. NPDC091268]|uniref:hypothetical protein n=1 Tax=Streptomyces sp. NPDC091268 TaxID=3365979 RepID=UPI0038177FD3